MPWGREVFCLVLISNQVYIQAQNVSTKKVIKRFKKVMLFDLIKPLT
ncbi:hypothetical protein RG47T_0003 [Mucilaginibacter polytrichastri]|uniref:Uncharacterized protein n=1 Tax=Mucilaginibacter polytrichastri TaxID=1302689 RepID=A0A1Q5ZS22_9SPHI|nr:hypothetical protein RG47T_0003 [Mucilaginibacter polytrichastri]